jgi:hypothetical protein
MVIKVHYLGNYIYYFYQNPHLVKEVLNSFKNRSQRLYKEHYRYRLMKNYEYVICSIGLDVGRAYWTSHLSHRFISWVIILAVY